MNTNKEIEEGNKLIAEFMGIMMEVVDGVNYPKDKHQWEVTLEPEYIQREFYGTKEDVFERLNLKYHTSWDWLVPVIEKAKDYLQNMERPSQHHCCKGDLLEVDIQCALWELNIEKTWEAVIPFIKWYNISKTTTMNQSNQSGMSEEIKRKIEKRANNYSIQADSRRDFKIGAEYGYNLSQPSTVGDEVVYVPVKESEITEGMIVPDNWLFSGNTIKNAETSWLKPVPLSSLIPARVSEEDLRKIISTAFKAGVMLENTDGKSADLTETTKNILQSFMLKNF